MPLNRCQEDNKPGWKWGDAGKCYTYTAGNEESELNARKKALAQAAAMGEFPGTGQNRSGEPVEIRSAQITGVDFPKRTIEVIAVPYDQEGAVFYEGQMRIETVAPGAFDGIETRNDHVPVNRDHDPARVFGKVTAWRPADSAGLVAAVYASDTVLGNETLRLAADGVLKASIGMLVRRSDQILRRDSRRIKRAFVDHLAMVPNPVYHGAEVLAVRQEQQSAADAGPRSMPNLDEILNMNGILDLLDQRR